MPAIWLMDAINNYTVTATSILGTVLVWAVTPASSRHWSRQDGGATPKLGPQPNLCLIDFRDIAVDTSSWGCRGCH